MLGIKMRPVAVSVLAAAFAFNIYAPASAATIFLPVSVSAGNLSPDVIETTVRISAAGNSPAALSSPKTGQLQPDPVAMMWALLTGSFALIGMVVRHGKRSPSVTS